MTEGSFEEGFRVRISVDARQCALGRFVGERSRAAVHTVATLVIVEVCIGLESSRSARLRCEVAQLADVFCWIKVIDTSDGKVVSNGGAIGPPGHALVRYVVANDGNKVAGPLTVWGELYRNRVKIPNVLAPQQITLEPNEIWKKEYPVSEGGGVAMYLAKLRGDVENAVGEENEANNLAQRSFSIVISL